MIFEDREKCQNAFETDVCQIGCEANHISFGDNTRRSGFFVCEEDGKWSPPMSTVQPLDCQRTLLYHSLPQFFSQGTRLMFTSDIVSVKTWAIDTGQKFVNKEKSKIRRK